jgi:hypothetical protein
MKKILPLLLAVLLLSACGAASSPAPAAQTATPEPVRAPEAAPAAATPELSPSAEPLPSPSPETDWRAAYQPVFDCYSALKDSVAKGEIDFNSMEIYDLTPNFDLLTYSKAKLGYTLQDLDGDEVPELIVGLMTDDFYYSNIAAALFTMKDSAPSLVFTSMARSRYQYFSEGCFLYEGSGGAAYYDVFVCRYSGGEIHEEYGAFHEGDRGFFLVTAGGKESGILTEIAEDAFYEYVDKLDRMIGSAPILKMMEIYEG